jgi:hypothetical protein
VLRDEIERWLRARSLYDVHIVVHCEWAAERTKA